MHALAVNKPVSVKHLIGKEPFLSDRELHYACQLFPCLKTTNGHGFSETCKLIAVIWHHSNYYAIKILLHPLGFRHVTGYAVLLRCTQIYPKPLFARFSLRKSRLWKLLLYWWHNATAIDCLTEGGLTLTLCSNSVLVIYAYNVSPLNDTTSDSVSNKLTRRYFATTVIFTEYFEVKIYIWMEKAMKFLLSSLLYVNDPVVFQA